MAGSLEDLFNTRTQHDRSGTLRGGCDETLFWRDLERLKTEGLVEEVQRPSDADSDFRETRYFRDLLTGETFVYVGGWERGSPEFRRVQG